MWQLLWFSAVYKAIPFYDVDIITTRTVLLLHWKSLQFSAQCKFNLFSALYITTPVGLIRSLMSQSSLYTVQKFRVLIIVYKDLEQLYYIQVCEQRCMFFIRYAYLYIQHFYPTVLTAMTLSGNNVLTACQTRNYQKCVILQRPAGRDERTDDKVLSKLSLYWGTELVTVIHKHAKQTAGEEGADPTPTVFSSTLKHCITLKTHMGFRHSPTSPPPFTHHTPASALTFNPSVSEPQDILTSAKS